MKSGLKQTINNYNNYNNITNMKRGPKQITTITITPTFIQVHASYYKYEAWTGPNYNNNNIKRAPKQMRNTNKPYNNIKRRLKQMITNNIIIINITIINITIIISIVD